MHPKYTLFGTTVNTASRMESSSEPNRVQCTKETADLIKRDTDDIGVHFRKRMDVKGRGFLDTYYLTAPEAGFKSIRPKRDSSSRRTKVRHSIGDLQQSIGFDSSTFLHHSGIPEEDTAASEPTETDDAVSSTAAPSIATGTSSSSTGATATITSSITPATTSS